MSKVPEHISTPLSPAPLSMAKPKPEKELAPPGRLPLVGALIFALLAEGLLGVALLLGPGSAAGLSLLELGDLVISGLFALGSCFLAGIVVRGRERSAWLLFGSACLGVLVAQGTRLFSLQGIASLLPNSSASLPSVSTLALIAQNILLFLAFLVLPPALQQRLTISRVRQFFDGALVVGAAAIGAAYFIFVPLSQSHASGENVQTPAIMVAADLLLLGGLTFALRSAAAHQPSLRSALRWLTVAIVLVLASDTITTLQMADQPLMLSSPLQAVLNAAYLCLGLGAMIRLRGEGQARSETGERGSSSWQTLPFIIVVLMAGAIVVVALLNPGETLPALVCVALLVALVGARYLVSVFESHQIEHENQLLARELAQMNEEFDGARAGQQAQTVRIQEGLRQIEEGLTQFMYGQHEARLPVEANEFASLTMNLNLLLDGTARQLQDHDHSRDLLVIRTLVDALGRLALGELHDLPELPPPGGTPIDALVKGIIQVRTRLLNLQSAIQQYQMEQQHLQQQLETLHRQVAQEVQGEQQLLLQMNEGLEAQLKTERQVSQAAEEQLQQERRSHETRLRAVEARAQEAEAALKAAEQQLRLDYEALDRRIKAERQEMEERLRSVSQPDPARTARLREQGEALASQFSTQSERLHTAATALQTAAEVARLLARSIEETAALPALKASAPSVPAPAAPQPAAQTLSAMQMLEQLAGIRAADSAPPTPPATGPLLGGANQEIIKRLHTAATRAEDMSGGLADLAAELIQESSNSKLAAENAGHLTTDLEQAAQPTPTTLRARQPARAVKTERP